MEEAIQPLGALGERSSAASACAVQFEGAFHFPFRLLICKSDAPLKCTIFSWLAGLGDNLIKRGCPLASQPMLLKMPGTEAPAPFVDLVCTLMLQHCHLPPSMSTPSAALLEWQMVSRQRIPANTTGLGALFMFGGRSGPWKE